MAIREEYQQLEAEIKKQEERRRKLDLISVGLAKQPDAFDILTAVFHQNGGLELDEVIDFIINSFSEIQEELNDRLNIEDILNHDKYQTLENPLHSIHLSNFQLHLDFIIAVLNHIKEERNSTTNPTGTYDKDITKKIDSTLRICEKVLFSYKTFSDNLDSIPFDKVFDWIQEYQVFSFSRAKENFYKYYKDDFLTIKQKRGLSDNEFDCYFEALAEKSYYWLIDNSQVRYLIIYLLFYDDEPRYVQLVIKVINLFLSYDQSILESDQISNRTITEIFNLFKKLPANIIKNILLYLKAAGDIDIMQYSSILEAIHTSDYNLFKSSINNDIASLVDRYYPEIEFAYSFCLLENSNTNQEIEMSFKYMDMVLTKLMPELQSKITNSTKSLNRSSYLHDPQILELYIENSPIILGFYTYFYRRYRHLLHTDDKRFFDRVFSQQPYKQYCDKALLELDKQYPNNKSFPVLLNLMKFPFENNNQSQSDETISDALTEVTEDITVSELELELESESKLESEPNECEMIPNPFKGLNGDAKKICNYDKKGYVGLFIDYLIDRGYIDCKNKDAFVCCLCEDMIPESALDNLKYNVKNKEGISNANIVTMMIVTLTKCKKKYNQIVVDGRIISKGCIYFNKGQINNGELEEWCLFWPFLKDRIKKGKRPLFQVIESFLDSEIEDAKKRVEQFLNEYDEYKKGNPHSTKLDFIKMKHE